MQIITAKKFGLTEVSALTQRQQLPPFFALIVSLSYVMSGCTTTTPHENFKENLISYLGRIPNFTSEVKRDLVIRIMPSGNTEYRYSQRWHGRGLCTEIYEVDASTRKIIRVDFEAKDPERECILPP